MVRTVSTWTLKMRSTADLISGFVAFTSTRKVRSWRPSCDSSLATSAFSVMTGALMTSQIVRMLRRLLFLRVLFAGRGGRRVGDPLRVELRLQDFGRRARQHQLLVVEHVVDVDAVGADDLRRLHVARGQDKVVVVDAVDDQRLPFEPERGQGADELLRLRLAEDQLVDDDEVALAQALRQGRAQRAAAHLLRQGLRPVARLRPVDVAAALPERRADRRDARAARALLLPELPARAGDVAAGLRPHGALAGAREVGLDGRVDQRLVQLGAEDGVRQFEVADLFVLQVAHLDGRHFVYSVYFADLRTTTTLPLAPGTEPRTISRLFSTSTRATVRPLSVTRASPMWPDERVPLMTREG